jgi:fluoride exporter
MTTILAIAAGGALGALMRHGLNTGITHFAGTGFPWGILVINVLGSFILGVFVAAFAHFWGPSQTVRAFLVVGMLGAFTTFSTFSMDSVLLIERSAYGAAAFYVIASVSLAVAGFMGGMILVRSFVS